MEEYTQITLDEWTEWKEDIRRKLQETAQNFVYIGYRLRQIRDSGMLDGCSDIFEFANREYGLGKSTVSRFIAINEKFSEGGYSLEMRKEYQAIGSSKLSEMLTLTEAECQLITEKTTVREIRELKRFDRQQDQEPEQEEAKPEISYTPLQKCIIDMFSDARGQQELAQIMELLQDAELSTLQKAFEIINPGEYRSNKKGIVFLFMYDWQTGIKYKLMTKPEPERMSWVEFLTEISNIYGECYQKNGLKVWENFYQQKDQKTQENQGLEATVATSQQDPKGEENEVPVERNNRVDTSVQNQEKLGTDNDTDIQPALDGGEGERELLPDEEREGESGGTESDRQENSNPERQEGGKQELESNIEPQIPGQDNILNHPEYLPPEMQQKKELEEIPEQSGIEVVNSTVPTIAEYMKEAAYLSDRVFQTLFYWNGESISTERVELVKEHLEQLVTICNQLLDTAEDGWIKAD